MVTLSAAYTGQMEVTFLRTFCSGVNLRGMLPTLAAMFPKGSVFGDVFEHFLKYYQLKTQGTFLSDLLAFQYSAENPTLKIDDNKTEPLSSEIYDLLLSTVNKFLEPSEQYLPWTYWNYFSSRLLNSRAQFVKKVAKDGVSLGIVTKTRTKSSGNSFILFRLQAGQPVAFGQIERIFLHWRGTGNSAVVESFLIVREYAPLCAEHSVHDPYRAIQDLDARLYYNRFLPGERLLRLSNVIAHAATLTYTPSNIEEACIVARSLDRVSYTSMSPRVLDLITTIIIVMSEKILRRACISG